MNLFLDLDGTLIDSRERLYKLFQHLVPSSTLSFQEYWQSKRQGVAHEQMLTQQFNYSPQELENFNRAWMAMIELPEWLTFDKPFPGVPGHLGELRRYHNLFLITARQHQDPVTKQLSDFGLSNFFMEVLVTHQIADKKSVIEKVLKPHPEDWIIGDTGMDVKTGKALGIKTAAVLTGFLSKESLLQYKPDLLLESILDFTIGIHE